MLVNRNGHRRDGAITFEEKGHVYTVIDSQGNKINPMSTTTLIHSLFPHFNAKAIIEKMFRSGSAQKNYPGMTGEEIEVAWKKNGEESSSLGTRMHNDIECFINGEEVSNDTIEYSYFQRFWRDLTERYPDLTPYRTEWMIYDEVAKVSGSIDFVLSTKQGDLVLVDWKRSKEIKTANRYEHGYGPLDQLDNCNYNHYLLQLNVYRHMLETSYDKRVIFMMLVVIHPNAEGYECIVIPRREDLISKLWSHRLSTLK